MENIAVLVDIFSRTYFVCLALKLFKNGLYLKKLKINKAFPFKPILI